jgi:1-deoxy-D-xylulose-5-phosphate reductoisomerase
MKRKRLSILGSTGSIGCNALAVAEHLGFPVLGIAAHHSIDQLEVQAKRHQPALIAVFDGEQAEKLKKKLPGYAIRSGLEGLCEVAALEKSDMLVSAMAGAVGILPTVTAILSGKDIALANKEVLVSAGQYVMQLAHAHGVRIMPIDSEHSALFQCLERIELHMVRRLILTASGGPFLHSSPEELAKISYRDALQHPTWKMGVKNTIDSSTLMNKGLEVIEARWLYGIPASQIDVVAHPQSLIHSMVELIDGSMLAQLSLPDMRLPIQYALTYPERLPSQISFLDFSQMHCLQFYPVDRQKFRCLDLGYVALNQGKSAACFLNAANEVLVERFRRAEIKWCEISEILERLLSEHTLCDVETIDQILAVDAAARLSANQPEGVLC